MSIKELVLALGLVGFVQPASAMDVAGYHKSKSKSLELTQLYMAGAGAGLMAANAEATNNHLPLYCQPGKLALNGDNYVSIADKQIVFMQSLYTGADKRDALEKSPYRPHSNVRIAYNVSM